ncbi:unnamed protein product [Arabidopsis thaliana]|uniref:Uncharacterized protein n=1 Tax=Arabidopsis thaliana TaxID=3702 RepID=A0A5S9YAD0_ARATH|nr:unnamed protein product [Arabidopsis thaliana]
MSLPIENKEGFDTTEASDGPELQKSICDKRWSPCCTLVRLYARMGLHRYSLLKDGALITECYFYVKGDLPKCPSEDIFENRKRFYVVEESKLQVNDWILLYLEVAVATTHRSNGKYHDLSDLKIFESSEDVEPPNELLLKEASMSIMDASLSRVEIRLSNPIWVWSDIYECPTQ